MKKPPIPKKGNIAVTTKDNFQEVKNPIMKDAINCAIVLNVIPTFVPMPLSIIFV